MRKKEIDPTFIEILKVGITEIFSRVRPKYAFWGELVSGHFDLLEHFR